MIDAQQLRANPDQIKQSQRARGSSETLVDKALQADTQHRKTLAHYETLRAKQNTLGKQIGTASKNERPKLLEQAKQLAEQVKQAQTQTRETEEQAQLALYAIDNPIQPGVPAGGEENFVTLREHGTKPVFDYTPRDHLELGTLIDAIDMERGAKVSGSRFYFLRGIGARLDLAIMNMGLQCALEAGFTPLITPTLVRENMMAGTGFLGEHADEVYRLPADELYLTGTSEVALAGYHADEILDLTEGPIRYTGWSTCYRREAGAHGKDTRGIMRVHQFNKLEMFVYTTPENAQAEHEHLLALQEQMLQALQLTYRVIDVAAGDLGASASRKYDIEAWIPSQNTYRELTSTSNCTTFQARRLRTRFRDETGKTTPAATLNGTLATTRWLTALLETHQNSDGSVNVPKALQPYLGGLKIIETKNR